MCASVRISFRVILISDYFNIYTTSAYSSFPGYNYTHNTRQDAYALLHLLTTNNTYFNDTIRVHRSRISVIIHTLVFLEKVHDLLLI